jgi:hypothetical protein
MPLALDHEPEMFSMEEFLAAEQAKDLVRFSTAGSVDDGKSTLIGRLLYDSQNVYEDHVRAVTKAATANVAAAIDFAQLTDGLRAEREQGITIDVAYRYFSTTHRKFIIADTPGHEQYTRNMATGASTADVAIILVDARKGILTQSRRHAYIASLLGTRHVGWSAICNSLPVSLAFPICRSFPSVRYSVTTWSIAARACPGMKAQRCFSISRPCPSGRTWPQRPSVCPCSG